MANNYFQFKQFTIHQDRCAMKVTTDACLFGGLVASYVKEKAIQSILDIGAGTGLLSLMLAQETASSIVGIEIEKNAAQQAIENVENSPWNNRVRIIETSIQTYTANTEGKFDLIICNPPFFADDLKSPDPLRNQAMHEADLSLRDLLGAVQQLRSPNGFFALLLPYRRASDASKLADEKSLRVAKRIDIRQTPNHDYFRTALIFSEENARCKHESITIKASDAYTEAFQHVLAPYYLYL